MLTCCHEFVKWYNILMPDYKPRNMYEEELFEALQKLKNKQDIANFLRDLLTQNELSEFANRLQIAKLLQDNELSYLEIASRTGASTTTITRVAEWLRNGHGGYGKAMSK